MAMVIDEKKRRLQQQSAQRGAVQAVPTQTRTAGASQVQQASSIQTPVSTTSAGETATAKPQTFQSVYQPEMERLYQEITSRKPFQFDATQNPLWQQYQDYYTRAGQQAMRDTMGQAAALTGGYGSSYGQNVGQQAYNAYMQELSAQIPELYEMERAAYDAETDRLYQQYTMAQGRENQAYNRWQDEYDRWFAEQQAAQSQSNWEREFDYTTSKGSGSGSGSSSSSSDYEVDDYMDTLARQFVSEGVGTTDLRTELSQYYDDVDDGFVSFFWDYMQWLKSQQSQKQNPSAPGRNPGEVYTGW